MPSLFLITKKPANLNRKIYEQLLQAFVSPLGSIGTDIAQGWL